MNKPDLLTTTTTTMTTTSTSTAKPATTITINMMMRMVDDGIEMRKKWHNTIQIPAAHFLLSLSMAALMNISCILLQSIFGEKCSLIYTQKWSICSQMSGTRRKKVPKDRMSKPMPVKKGKRKRERESCNRNDSISYSRLSVKLFANANGYIGIEKPIENLHFHWKISKMAPNWISLRWFSLPENEQTSQRSRSRIHLL